MKVYPFLKLSTIEQYEPEMIALRVSEVARSPRGFLAAYKDVGGNPNRLHPAWLRKRNGFIARHLAQYKIDHGKRRRLALIAWAYDPER